MTKPESRVINWFMEQYVYKKLGNKDAADFRSIRARALSEKPSYFGRSPHELETEADAIKGINDGFVLGCFYKADLVGITGVMLQHGERRWHKAIIWGVYVDPPHRRMGVNTAMLREVITSAPSHIEQLHLDVAVKNEAAVSAYKKIGFEIYGTEPRARKVKNEYFDEFLMVYFRSAKT